MVRRRVMPNKRDHPALIGTAIHVVPGTLVLEMNVSSAFVPNPEVSGCFVEFVLINFQCTEEICRPNHNDLIFIFDE